MTEVPEGWTRLPDHALPVFNTLIGPFCAKPEGEDGIAYEKRMERVIGRLEAVRKPTVAVIDGYAIGGGLSIAAVSDLRICTPEAAATRPASFTSPSERSSMELARC